MSGGYWCLTRTLGLLQYKIIKEKLLIQSHWCDVCWFKIEQFIITHTWLIGGREREIQYIQSAL